MSARPVKFMFDAQFGVPEVSESERYAARLAAAEARFAKELAAARETAFSEGMAKGRQAEAEAVSAQLSQQLTELLTRFGSWESRFTAEMAKIRAEAMELAWLIGRKLGGAALDRFPAEPVTALLRECLEALPDVPRFRLHLPEPLAEEFQQRLAQIQNELGNNAQITVHPDGALAPGDCRITWQDGGMERDRAELEAHIAETVTAHLDRILAEQVDDVTERITVEEGPDHA